MTLEKIKQETKHDAEMQAVIKAVETDQWSVPEVQNYKKLKEELSVFNGLKCWEETELSYHLTSKVKQ